MSSQYDVIIVGAGPAGIFAALELTKSGVSNILMVEKGHAISKRHCPARQTACISCKTCAIMTGWGGAGAFSDGKL
ncbi:MAG TPA: FAD-dependent oxidoreductase, partial [Coriobacteriia bacterium]|nr:FAD-dependent oxidoreductase [Coriobacteriia bacterium]